MRIVLNILLFWLFNFSLFSQGFNRSYSINQGSTVLLDATVFFDGNIYASAAFFDTTQNVRIVNGLMKINYASGNIDTIIFERLPRHFSLRKKAMTNTMDSCIVVTGNIMTIKDTIVLYKYDSDSLLWYKTYADPNAMSFFSINILQSNDSAYYLLVNYQENSYDVNTMVIKLRSNGEEIWRRKYGGGSHSEIPQCMTWMPDGSILIGSSKSNFAHVPILTPELYPTWLFRIDTAGQLLDQWTNPDPMSWFPGALAPTPDGGIVFAGAYTEYHSNSGYAVTKNYVRKLQSNYVLEWELILGNSAGAINFLENLNIYDNKIFIVGIEYDSTFKKASEISLPYQNYYGVLYCFDLNGNTIYKRYFHVPSPVRDLPGVWGPTPIIYSINIPNDSTLLMAGELRVAFSPPQPTIPTQYGWLIKTDLKGCLAPDDCDYIGIEEQPNEPLLRCWPNPASEQLSLQVDEPWLHSRFTILNLQGQTLQRGLLVAPLTIFDVQQWPPGLYIIHLLKNGIQTQVKWIKQ